MNNDKQVIHNLWWLRYFLNKKWEGKEYKEVIYEDITDEITEEIDTLVRHINETYNK